jgi:purine-binding chemotaxis protein CheW
MLKKEKRAPRGKKKSAERNPVRSNSVSRQDDSPTAVLEIMPDPPPLLNQSTTQTVIAEPAESKGEGPDRLKETEQKESTGVQSEESAPTEKEETEVPLVVDEKTELLGFSMNLEEYAIPVSQIKEIIRMTDMTVIPGSSPILLGIISLRGVIIPVFKLSNKLATLKGSEGEASTENEDDKLRRIIIVQIDQGCFGLMVDCVTDVIKITEDEIKPPPPLLNQMGQEMIRGIATFKNRLVILLFIERIVDVIQNEMKAIRNT